MMSALLANKKYLLKAFLALCLILTVAIVLYAVTFKSVAGLFIFNDGITSLFLCLVIFFFGVIGFVGFTMDAAAHFKKARVTDNAERAE